MGRRRRTRTSSVELFGAEFNELSRKKSGGHFVPLAEMPRWPTPMAGNDVTESAQTPTSASTNSSVDPLCEWIVKAEKNVEKSMKASDCKSLSEYNKNKEEREREKEGRAEWLPASSFQVDRQVRTCISTKDQKAFSAGSMGVPKASSKSSPPNW